MPVMAMYFWDLVVDVAWEACVAWIVYTDWVVCAYWILDTDWVVYAALETDWVPVYVACLLDMDWVV